VQCRQGFLKGRANFYRFTPEHILEARKCLEEAIEIDPKFADAYSYLSLCHFWGWSQLLAGFDDNLDRANEIAEKAMALDGSSTSAVMSLGWIKAWLQRYDDSFAIFEKALALAPNNAEVIAMFGQVLNFWGNPERGLEMIEKSFKLETFPPPNWELWAGHSHFLLRQYDQALLKFNLMVERAPKFAFVYMLLACAYAELERLDDARNSIKTLLEISPRYTLKDAAKFAPYRLDEHRNRFLEGLRKAGLPEG
jgi:adenylate cyclase